MMTPIPRFFLLPNPAKELFTSKIKGRLLPYAGNGREVISQLSSSGLQWAVAQGLKLCKLFLNKYIDFSYRINRHQQPQKLT